MKKIGTYLENVIASIGVTENERSRWQFVSRLLRWDHEVAQGILMSRSGDLLNRKRIVRHSKERCVIRIDA